MKNTYSIISAIVLFILFQAANPAASMAQSTDKIDFYLDGGIGIPAAPADFSEFWKAGYGLGAGASYEVRPNVKLQLYGQYYRFSFDEEGARNNVVVPDPITSIDGATADMYHIMLNLIYEYNMPGTPTTPYFSFGGGYLRTVRSDFTVSTSEGPINIDQNSGSALGVNGAVGIKQAISRSISIKLEAKFVTALFVDRRTQYVPISVGLQF